MPVITKVVLLHESNRSELHLWAGGKIHKSYTFRPPKVKSRSKKMAENIASGSGAELIIHDNAKASRVALAQNREDHKRREDAEETRTRL